MSEIGSFSTGRGKLQVRSCPQCSVSDGRPEKGGLSLRGQSTARSEALVIISAPDFFRDAAVLSRLALEAGLPTVCEWASMARDGCLIGYGPNFAALWRRPAEYVARILRGEKPGSCRSSNQPCSSLLLT